MNLLSDVITYIRRIIKSPSNAVITDNLIIDYINRFWLMDVDARIQLFDLKTKYQFLTTPGIDQYNMPLYNVQTEGSNPPSDVNFYPVYQGFTTPAFINGIQAQFYTQRELFFNLYPNYVQPLVGIVQGNGGATYTINIPFIGTPSSVNAAPSGLLAGHVDITGVIATGVNQDPPINTTIYTQIPTTSIIPAIYINSTDSTGANVVVCDSGQFLTGNLNYGLLMRPGQAPFGNLPLSGGYNTALNTINYQTGQATFTFTNSGGGPLDIPAGQNINVECYYWMPGLPRSILYYNNVLTLRSVPYTQYVVELDAYLTPAAFMNSGNAIQFGYMAEYIARGAARKILADTGDIEQFQFYEPLFREQEILVWKRSQRQFTATRTETIYSVRPFSNNNQSYSGM